MRRYTLILLACLISSAAVTIRSLAADGDVPTNSRIKQIASQAQTREFTEQFLTVLVKGRPFDAFALIKATVPDLEADVEATRQSTELRFEQVRPTYGKPINWELIQTKTLGQSLVRYDYIIKFEKNAMQFRVLYYKPNAVWIPAYLDFTTDLTGLFEDAGK